MGRLGSPDQSGRRERRFQQLTPASDPSTFFGRVAEWQCSRLITGGPGSPEKHRPGAGPHSRPFRLFSTTLRGAEQYFPRPGRNLVASGLPYLLKLGIRQFEQKGRFPLLRLRQCRPSACCFCHNKRISKKCCVGYCKRRIKGYTINHGWQEQPTKNPEQPWQAATGREQN